MEYYKYISCDNFIFFFSKEKGFQIFGSFGGYRCATPIYEKENCHAIFSFNFINSSMKSNANYVLERGYAIEISKEEFDVHCNFAIEILQSNVSNKEMKLAKFSGNDFVDAFNYKQVISKQNEIQS